MNARFEAPPVDVWSAPAEAPCADAPAPSISAPGVQQLKQQRASERVRITRVRRLPARTRRRGAAARPTPPSRWPQAVHPARSTSRVRHMHSPTALPALGVGWSHATRSRRVRGELAVSGPKRADWRCAHASVVQIFPSSERDRAACIAVARRVSNFDDGATAGAKNFQRVAGWFGSGSRDRPLGWSQDLPSARHCALRHCGLPDLAAVSHTAMPGRHPHAVLPAACRRQLAARRRSAVARMQFSS